MSGIQRFLTKRGEKYRRQAKQEKEVGEQDCAHLGLYDDASALWRLTRPVI